MGIQEPHITTSAQICKASQMVAPHLGVVLVDDLFNHRFIK